LGRAIPCPPRTVPDATGEMDTPQRPQTFPRRASVVGAGSGKVEEVPTDVPRGGNRSSASRIDSSELGQLPPVADAGEVCDRRGPRRRPNAARRRRRKPGRDIREAKQVPAGRQSNCGHRPGQDGPANGGSCRPVQTASRRSPRSASRAPLVSRRRFVRAAAGSGSPRPEMRLPLALAGRMSLSYPRRTVTVTDHCPERGALGAMPRKAVLRTGPCTAGRICPGGRNPSASRRPTRIVPALRLVVPRERGRV